MIEDLKMQQLLFAIRRRRRTDFELIPAGIVSPYDYFKVDYTTSRHSMEYGLKQLALNADLARNRLVEIMKNKRPGWRADVKSEREFISSATVYIHYLNNLLLPFKHIKHLPN